MIKKMKNKHDYLVYFYIGQLIKTNNIDIHEKSSNNCLQKRIKSIRNYIGETSNKVIDINRT